MLALPEGLHPNRLSRLINAKNRRGKDDRAVRGMTLSSASPPAMQVLSGGMVLPLVQEQL